ncbi:MinD/ParA family ATP-binding protein [Nonomuraea zeae]|uniref:MinD/ParA family ATP-binding protein n=1 Tax=Nonomuraea zeae TaxID=1642303 RepID=UPI001F0EC283|nr:MinD/ParA family protein [Nonomuraea zeae]
MARHDREESLEEQLAWLDAIKETEEAPVPVSASTASADEPIASPYPKDPWGLVPTQHDTPTPPLFRAAVDSVYGADAAEDLPERESDAAEWLGTATARQEPVAPAPSRDEPDDPFLAPLKPLPRLDDTDTYSLALTTPDTKKPEQPEAAEPGDGAGEAEEAAESSWPPAGTQKSADRQKSAGAEKSAGTEKAGLQRQEPAHKEEPAEEDGHDAWSDTLPRNERPQWTEPETPKDEPDKPAWAADPEKKPSWAAEAEQKPSWAAEGEKPSWAGSEQRDEPEDRPHRDEPSEPPHWGESEPRPNWAESETRPNWSEPEIRPAWSESDARPSWAESETRPNWDLPGERPQWAEREERPQWSDPEERPQWTDPLRQQERPQWPEQQEWRPAEREIPQPHAPEPQPQPQPERPHQQDQPRPRRRPAPIPVFTAPPRPPVTGRPTAESLDPESLLRGRRNAPSKGWRRLIYKASGGWIKPGEPPEVRRRRELVTRARTPVTAGHHRVAVLSLKGGVGKTTTTVGLGATLAQMRGDRVIAVDANPDRGTLSDKLVLETSATVRDLLNEREQVKRYVDIRAFTSQAASRLEILASDRDPSVSEAFSGGDYQAVSQVLENFYSICLTDCGTGLLHSAMGGVLGLADQIVLVSSPSVDGARAASATLDWLEAHHYGDLVKAATVVLCSVRPRSKSAVDIKKLEAHFAARCRAVIRVPYDPHLEEGAEIDLDRLQESTRDAYLQLAACVGDGFAGIRE